MTQPFDLTQASAYQRWRDAKLAKLPRQASDLIVDVVDPRSLQKEELLALIKRCSEANMAIYRSPIKDEDKAIPPALGSAIGPAPA